MERAGTRGRSETTTSGCCFPPAGAFILPQSGKIAANRAWESKRSALGAGSEGGYTLRGVNETLVFSFTQIALDWRSEHRNGRGIAISGPGRKGAVKYGCALGRAGRGGRQRKGASYSYPLHWSLRNLCRPRAERGLRDRRRQEERRHLTTAKRSAMS